MWLEDIFKTKKPVIGMVHLYPMPTDPKYNEEEGIQGVVEAAYKDIIALQDGGINGLLFCNEFSIPYTRNVRIVTVATYARVVGELLRHIKVPFGITLSNKAEYAFDIAKATGASFVRAHYHGATAGVYGLDLNDPGDVERHRKYLGLENIKVLSAVIPEGTEQIAKRDLKQVVKTLTFNVNPDGMLIYSSTPGSAIDIEQVKTIKQISNTPVFASNGVKIDTVEEILEYADGCIVGTGIKYDGEFYNQIDPKRVKELMQNARKIQMKFDK